MFNIMLSLIAASLLVVTPFALDLVSKPTSSTNSNPTSQLPSIYPQVDGQELRAMLRQQAPNLPEAVINKVVAAMKCSSSYHIQSTPILSVIDYSQPSNQKRFWIFDLAQKKLLFNTFVAHGIKSGTLLTNNFSNKYNSKASSFGVYKTDKAYYGREGLSLRLAGLERNFNDNAMNRSIVMHGGWYMDEGFINRYGRPGRSWGCPAVPLTLYKPIINTIKDNSLLVIYYPSDEWFGHSKFLTCAAAQSELSREPTLPTTAEDESRDEVFFAQVYKGGEDKPILVMPAGRYEHVFHEKAPLGRMLRRQINKEEYIALNNAELNKLVSQNNREGINGLSFAIATLKMAHGYYETEMKLVNLGTINDISPAGNNKTYTVRFNTNSNIRLESTTKFIRWLGL